MRQYTLTKLTLQHLVIYFRRCYCRRCLRLIAGSAVYGCKYQASLITEKDVLQTKLGYAPLSCRAFLIFIVLSGSSPWGIIGSISAFSVTKVATILHIEKYCWRNFIRICDYFYFIDKLDDCFNIFFVYLLYQTNIFSTHDIHIPFYQTTDNLLKSYFLHAKMLLLGGLKATFGRVKSSFLQTAVTQSVTEDANNHADSGYFLSSEPCMNFYSLCAGLPSGG